MAETDSWQEKLRAGGYRLTPQRELVLTAVETLGHATPEEVYGEVRRHSSAINQSTVYRTLELLDELGLIRHAHIEERTPTYHSVAGHEHFHLVCHHCRQVTSLGSGRIARFRTELAEEFGFAVDVGHLTIFGTCAECAAAADGNPDGS
jgi:Fur family ferric uptake transcriptional regulator